MAKKQTTKKDAGRTRRTIRKGSARTPATPVRSKKERTRAPRLPAPGGMLTRTFKGREVRVTVLDQGFRFDGKEWRSLTSIARSLTGYPVSGPHFFGIDAPRAATEIATKTATATA